jgi:hypothetical protein
VWLPDLEDLVAMTPPATISQASRPAAGLTAFFLRAAVRFHRPTDVSQEPYLSYQRSWLCACGRGLRPYFAQDLRTGDHSSARCAASL